MDDTPQEQMREEREQRANSKHRDDDAQAGLALFERMCAGDEEAGKWCLRAKIDMTSDNGTMRDPVMFRQNLTPHHKTGTRYKAYPTYDLACPIVDSIEGVTHALRTTEYNDRDAQYAWLQDAMKLRKVRIHAFARLNFVHTLMSKRKLAWFVDEGRVEGWNDPRFPTIQGVVRRGVSIDQLRAFMVSQGASRNIVNMEWDSFWAINKNAFEPTATRFMAVAAQPAPATLTITNFASAVADGANPNALHALTIPKHPKDDALGTRALRIAPTVLLEALDAADIKAGDAIILSRWGAVQVTARSAGGALEGELQPSIDAFKHLKGKQKPKALHWLADLRAPAGAASAERALVACELVEYDHLITKPKLEEHEKITDAGVINERSSAVTPALADPLLRALGVGDVVQLERRGFFRCDRPYVSPAKPLVLVYVPDGKKKPPVFNALQNPVG